MTIAQKLSGGDPRSLGQTDQVIQQVMAQPKKLGELFDCLFSDDETVRMRAGDALEKICRDQPGWFTLYKARLLTDVPKIKQASVQWHLAQIFAEIELNPAEQKQATTIMQHNLKTMDDWIVTNLTLESLAQFVRRGDFDRGKFVRLLQQNKNSRHKSVVSRVNKLLTEFAQH